jgi:glycosyltransferase involved in cell wall biosynthesis
MTSVVGIIVPCFNQGQYVEECVNSLYAQTYQFWKAVVINDASTDAYSREKCNKVGSNKVIIKHLEQNMGRSLVRNAGVELLGAVDYIINIDCDDYIEAHYIEKLVRVLNADRSIGLAYGALHYFGMNSNAKTWPTSPWNADRMYLKNGIPGPGTMIRADALRRTQGWRGAFTECGGEDYDVWLQVVELGWAPKWVASAIYHYRQHEASFLANTNSEKKLDCQLAILSHHAHGIRKSVGIEAYLQMRIGPAFVHAIRSGNLKQIIKIGNALMKVSPYATSKYMVKYYVRRVAMQMRGAT